MHWIFPAVNPAVSILQHHFSYVALSLLSIQDSGNMSRWFPTLTSDCAVRVSSIPVILCKTFALLCKNIVDEIVTAETR